MEQAKREEAMREEQAKREEAMREEQENKRLDRKGKSSLNCYHFPVLVTSSLTLCHAQH